MSDLDMAYIAGWLVIIGVLGGLAIFYQIKGDRHDR